MPYSVKRFRFRLQTLLNIEENRERQSQIAFTKAVHELRQEEAVLASYQQEQQEAQGTMLQEIRQGASPRQLNAYDAYFGDLKERMKAQQARIAEAGKKAEEAQQELAERTKQRKILEKLRERARKAYDEETRQVENTFLDEVGAVMSARKMME